MKKHSWLLLVAILALMLVVQQVGCNDDDDDDDNDDSPDGVDDDNDDDDDDNDDDNDNDDDDDDVGDDDDTGSGIAECDIDVNTPPFLYAVNLIVNGEVVEQPYTATTDDALALSFEYLDAECNIEHLEEYPYSAYRGMFYVFLDGRDEENLSEEAWNQLRDHRWSLTGIGCSSAESGPYLIELDPQDWVVDDADVREYPFVTSLRDACDAASDHFSLDFTVHAAK